MHRNPLHSYTLTVKNQREIKETIPFTTVTKIIKYLGISLLKGSQRVGHDWAAELNWTALKEAEDLYSENYKTLMTEIKDNINEKKCHVLGLENQYCQNDYTTQTNLQIQCNSY